MRSPDEWIWFNAKKFLAIKCNFTDLFFSRFKVAKASRHILQQFRGISEYLNAVSPLLAALIATTCNFLASFSFAKKNFLMRISCYQKCQKGKVLSTRSLIGFSRLEIFGNSAKDFDKSLGKFLKFLRFFRDL